METLLIMPKMLHICIAILDFFQTLVTLIISLDLHQSLERWVEREWDLYITDEETEAQRG